MKKNKKNSLQFREVIILAVVVSFITSAITGLIAGGLGNEWFQQLNLVQEKKLKERGESNYSVFSQEEAVVKAVEQATPAVVSIIASKDLPVIEQYYQDYNPFGNDDFLRNFFNDDFFDSFNFQIPQYRQKGIEKKEVGGGTGFIVFSSSDKGTLVLTNKHVVADQETEYTVLTNEGEKIPALVLARDPIQDIAILRIDRNNLPVIELGDSEEIKIGQTVIAIGNALGEFRNTVSLGVISGLKRSISVVSGFGQIEELSEVIQTDAAINPGNSGGPLLNLKGEAIGINVAIVHDAQSIGFALPINKAKRDIEQIRTIGKISYPFLGVRYLMITLSLQEENDLPVDYGALIIRGEESREEAVISNSPADKAGLTEDDIILEINGEKLTQGNDLAEIIQKYQAGEKISLKILRNQEEKIVEVELGER